MTPIISTTILRTQSDDRLVALAKDGHERAFEALVERYRGPLLRHVRRILPEARAEDAVQQAFLNAWSALERGVDVHEPRAWLYRVAENAALNALRVQGYEYDELRESVRSSAAGPAEDHERRWVMRRTLAGLAALPAAQREALLRTAVEGRSQEQVAAELGLSEGAVRGLVYRARTALRAAATALTPAPLVGWAAAFASSDAPMSAAERITQVAAGGGTASVGAVLAKAGAVVAVTGALATGAVAVRDSAESGGDGSNAQADTVKPGAHRHGLTSALPGASFAAGPDHGVAGEGEHHGRERGEDRGRGRGHGRGEAEGKGRGGRSGSSGGSGETRSGSNSGPSSGSGSSPGGSGSSGSSNSGPGSASSGSGASGSGRSGGDDGHSGSGSGASGGSGSSGPGPSGSGSSGSGGGPGPSGSDVSSSGPGGGGAQMDDGGGGSTSSGPGPGTPTTPTTTTSSTNSSGPGSGGSGGGGGHDLTSTDGSGSSGKGG